MVAYDVIFHNPVCLELFDSLKVRNLTLGRVYIQKYRQKQINFLLFYLLNGQEGVGHIQTYIVYHAVYRLKMSHFGELPDEAFHKNGKILIILLRLLAFLIIFS